MLAASASNDRRGGAEIVAGATLKVDLNDATFGDGGELIKRMFSCGLALSSVTADIVGGNPRIWRGDGPARAGWVRI